MENASFRQNQVDQSVQSDQAAQPTQDVGLTQDDLIYKIGEQQAHLMQKDKVIQLLRSTIEELEDARPEVKRLTEKLEDLSKSNQDYNERNKELADKLSELRGARDDTNSEKEQE